MRPRWPACSSGSARSSSRAPRTSSCSSSARCRSACSRFIGWSIGRRSCASVMLGVLLWATALTCAYYGIFAALMVGLGTLFFACTARTLAIARLLDRHRPGGVHQHRPDGAVLPALPLRAERDGLCPHARRRAGLFGESAGLGRFGGVGASLVAAGARRLQRGAVSRHPRDGARRRRGGGHRCRRAPSRRQAARRATLLAATRRSSTC